MRFQIIDLRLQICFKTLEENLSFTIYDSTIHSYFWHCGQ